MNYALIGLIWGILRSVLAYPIVKVALDNWTKGTSNLIDNMIWAMVKSAAGIKDTVAREIYVKKETAQIQTTYDNAKADGKLAYLKDTKSAWDMASLSLEDDYSSDNIA